MSIGKMNNAVAGGPAVSAGAVIGRLRPQRWSEQRVGGSIPDFSPARACLGVHEKPETVHRGRDQPGQGLIAAPATASGGVAPKVGNTDCIPLNPIPL
jgi:hypothetical protein